MNRLLLFQTLGRGLFEALILIFLVYPETGGWTTAVLFLLTAEMEFQHFMRTKV